MSYRPFARVLPVLVACLAVAGCGDQDLFTPTAPSNPMTFTVNFSGAVNQNGAATHTFATQASGTVTATLTSLAPASDALIGLSLGTWNGATCQIVLANDRATQGSVVTGGVSSFGNLCVRVYDVGTITAQQPFAYEITVVHP